MRSNPKLEEERTIRIYYYPGTGDPALHIESVRATRGTLTAVWKSEESSTLPDGDPFTTNTFVLKPMGERAGPGTEDALLFLVRDSKLEELRVPVVWD